MNKERDVARTNDKIVVISGPSGSGKSTLIHMLLQRNPEIYFSVSHTTRPRRKGEQNGRQYYFVSEPEFLNMRKENHFMEWARVHNHYYGTSHQEIKNKSEQDGMLILDLDVQGARNLKQIYPGAAFIFIVPPSLEVLKKRLVLRQGGRDQSEIKGRLAVARKELSQYGLYDFVVVNENLENAFSDLQCIYVALNHRLSHYRHIIEKIERSGK